MQFFPIGLMAKGPSPLVSVLTASIPTGGRNQPCIIALAPRVAQELRELGSERSTFGVVQLVANLFSVSRSPKPIQLDSCCR